MTAREFIEGKLAARLKERPGIAKGIGAVVAIALTGEGGGRWVLDLTKEPAAIASDQTTPAATTISMAVEVFEQMAGGGLDPQMAFLTGKVKVDGNLGIAIKLGQLLA